MTGQFTLEELQIIMMDMNADGCQCEKCANLRQKLEKMIAEYKDKPVIEHRDYSGIPATVEHLKG